MQDQGVYDEMNLVLSSSLSISQSLNLSLSLRDRDRADTIITLYHTTPSIHRKLFKPIEVRDLLPCFP